MKKSRIIILTVLLAILLVLGIIIATMYTSKELNKIVSFKNIHTIEYYDNTMSEFKELEGKQKNSFIDRMLNSKYKRKLFSDEDDNTYIYIITYDDNSKVYIGDKYIKHIDEKGKTIDKTSFAYQLYYNGKKVKASEWLNDNY